MGWSFQRLCRLFTLLTLVIAQCASPADASIGVVYGVNGDNIPIPSAAVKLLEDSGVTRVRIYDTTPDILKALVGSDIEVIVGIPNSDLATVGVSNDTAAAWLVTNVVPYALSVNITAIAVGNEVMTSFPSYTTSLVRTMTWIRDALVINGLDNRIKVSTPFGTSILTGAFPPSQAVFNQTLVPAIQPLLQLLNNTGSYVMYNAHTYDVFQSTFDAVSLQYALFQPDVPFTDTFANLAYFSLFDALLDACHAAMKQLNYGNLRIVVTETGWPTVGDSNENGASVSNAQAYTSNLVRHVVNSSSGTPAMPGVPITAYVYELFNEDLAQGPTSARNYGLFSYLLQPVYSVDLTGAGRGSSNGSLYVTYCVAKQGADEQALQSALDWACGQGGVNCTTTLLGGLCFQPDTLENHASWVFNAYYQANANAPGTCDFGGVANIVSFNPSYGSCIFQASNITGAVNGSHPGAPGPFSSSNDARPLQFQTGLTFGALLTVVVFNFRHLVG